jgi:uncharacterized protein YndB with AHSA1/START domain
MKYALLSPITVRATVLAPIGKVWEYWTQPRHIVKWYHASEDWHCPSAINDAVTGGKFNFRMEAVDGNFGFDFNGIYDDVSVHKSIAYTLPDGRQVNITFAPQGNTTWVVETFDPESENTADKQRLGWQAILDNFKKTVEQAK